MDWVEAFYSKQNEWFGVYLGPIEDSHRDRAALVQSFSACPPKARILELGAGGGQTAAALADLGFEVSMIELLTESVACAEQFALDYTNLEVIQGDFYKYDFPASSFDVICYFDSFGIGEDADQKVLLKRMVDWLKPEGRIVIEVGATWFWAGPANGVTMDLGGGMRSYHFDALESRLIDKWWLPDNPEEVYFQSLRCYTPADIKLLLEGTGLSLLSIKAGGKVDYKAMKFIEEAELGEAMTYYILLEKVPI